MVSSLQEQEYFLRNAILTVDYSKEVLQCFVEQHLKNNHQTFEEFLNQNQHDIFHLYYDAKCCQCGPGPLQRKKRVLFASQMELLFDKNRQLSIHKTTRRSDFCCCYANLNVTTAVLDLTLTRCLIMNCCLDMFWYSCLAFKGVTLEQFLNSNRHILYHLWKNNIKCCKCQPGFIFPCNAPIIMESEWKNMFRCILPPCENDRKRPSNGAISICAFSATPGITVQQIHLEVQSIIIQYCCSTRKSVEKLAELRKSTFDQAKKASMSCTEFNKFMSEAEDAILDLATVCGKEKYYKQRLLDLRDKPLGTRMCYSCEKVVLKRIGDNEDITKDNEVIKDGIDSLKSSNVQMKEKIEKLHTLQREKNIQLPWLVDGEEFQRMLSHGEYLSYENRLSLGGPCKAGKSSLASVLIGEQIPLQWNSTDGLVIYFGRNGIDIENKKMIPLREGERGHEVLAKILRGKPEVCKEYDHIIYTRQETQNSVRRKSREVSTILTSESSTYFTQDDNKNTKSATDQFAIKNYVPMAKSDTEHQSTQRSTIGMSSTDAIQTLDCNKLQLQSDILREMVNTKLK